MNAYIRKYPVLMAKCDKCGKRVWFGHMWSSKIAPFTFSKIYYDQMGIDFCEDCWNFIHERKENVDEIIERMALSKLFSS